MTAPLPNKNAPKPQKDAQKETPKRPISDKEVMEYQREQGGKQK
jgi:hypothetical protein